MSDDIKNLNKSVDLIAETTAKILETMATLVTKEDLNKEVASLKGEITDLREEMVNKFDGVNRRIDDISINKVGYDKFDSLKIRVDKLEEKV